MHKNIMIILTDDNGEKEVLPLTIAQKDWNLLRDVESRIKNICKDFDKIQSETKEDSEILDKREYIINALREQDFTVCMIVSIYSTLDI